MRLTKLFIALFLFFAIPGFSVFLMIESNGYLANITSTLLHDIALKSLWIFLLASLAFTLLLSPWVNQPVRYQHVEGPQIYKGYSAFRHAKRMLNVVSSCKGIWVHPMIQLGKLEELGNLFIFGMQGSGKSTVIKLWLSQLMKRAVSVLIYDEKREYTEQFFNENVLLLSPGDARSVEWDLSADIIDISSARSFADSVIHQASNEPFWSDSARIIVTGALMCLIKSGEHWGWGELHSLLFKDTNDLQKKLQIHFPEAALFADPENKTSASVLGVVASQLSWLQYVSQVKSSSKSKFSVNYWVNSHETKKLIVQTNTAHRSMSQSIFSALFSMLTNHVLSLPDCKEREVWLVLDELGAIPQNTSLEQWLSRGRSKGARTIAGTQSVSQLQSIYGEKDSETILGLFSTTIALRMGSAGQSASVASKTFGNRMVMSKSISTDEKGIKSITVAEKEVPVVAREKIVHLPKPDSRGVRGYMTIAGTNATYQLTWPYPNLPNVAIGFELIPLISNSPIQNNDANKNPFVR
jgi:energy-coupling factor transporter ATP-binding protein EcfA2